MVFVSRNQELPMDRVEVAILCTILYSDLFDAPLTLGELHHYLISEEPVSKDRIIEVLETSAHLRQIIVRDGEFLALKEHSACIANKKTRRAEIEHKWSEALRYGDWFKYVPFVRMVALTGAVAARNPRGPDDDYDYMLITEPRRVWLARAIAIILVRIARLRGVHLCPNLIIASDHLKQKRQDLYVAREIAQMVPLFGQYMYQELREQNQWTSQFLPNAAIRSGNDELRWHSWKTRLEHLLGGRLGDYLERWEYRRKAKRFQAQAALRSASAEINENQVKGHFQDHGHPILRKYYQRLQNYDLNSAAALQPAGSE